MAPSRSSRPWDYLDPVWVLDDAQLRLLLRLTPSAREGDRGTGWRNGNAVGYSPICLGRRTRAVWLDLSADCVAGCPPRDTHDCICAQVLIAVDRHSHSVSDTLYGVLPYVMPTLIVLYWARGPQIAERRPIRHALERRDVVLRHELDAGPVRDGRIDGVVGKAAARRGRTPPGRSASPDRAAARLEAPRRQPAAAIRDTVRTAHADVNVCEARRY